MKLRRTKYANHKTSRNTMNFKLCSGGMRKRTPKIFSANSM